MSFDYRSGNVDISADFVDGLYCVSFAEHGENSYHMTMVNIEPHTFARLINQWSHLIKTTGQVEE